MHPARKGRAKRAPGRSRSGEGMLGGLNSPAALFLSDPKFQRREGRQMFAVLSDLAPWREALQFLSPSPDLLPTLSPVPRPHGEGAARSSGGSRGHPCAGSPPPSAWWASPATYSLPRAGPLAGGPLPRGTSVTPCTGEPPAQHTP